MRQLDSYYLRKALVVAGQSRERMKHGAIVVRGGKIRGQSVNIGKNHPSTPGVPLPACSVHAEVRAMRAAGLPRRATVYVARAGAGGEPRFSKPCNACDRFLADLNCRAVWSVNEKMS